MRLLFVFFAMSSTLLAQGPVDGYMKNKKDFSVGLSFSNEKANKLYAGTNSINFGRTTRALSVFAIYGITNRINVQANIPYLNVNKGIEQDFQDASVYAKFLLFKKDNKQGNINIMLATGVSHPLADYQIAGGSALGQQATTADGRIIVQQNLKKNFFVSAQGGYFVKSSPTPNAFSSSLKIGYASKIYADIWFETLQAFGGTDYRGVGDLAPTSANGNFRGLGFSYNKIGGTVFYPFTKHFGMFTGVSYVLSGRNAFKNTGLNLGIVFQ